MNTVPICFCFDDNWVLPAGVAITSLLLNAHSDTFYKIYVLHDENAKYPTTNYFEPLKLKFSNFSLTFINVGREFQNSFEIRGITVAAYFRLLIPELLPQYDKIMYHDVDVVFQNDLYEIFEKTDLGDCYVAGVVSPACLHKSVSLEREAMGLDPYNYILSGNLIMNSKLMRTDGIVDQFRKEADKQYKYQDQDVINIVCKNRIMKLPVTFCSTIGAFEIEANNVDQQIYDADDLKKMIGEGIIHYNGPKPWDGYCPNFDIWWAYYRKSPFYSAKFYFDFFNMRMHEQDRFTLKKRLKILARYFLYGRKKD